MQARRDPVYVAWYGLSLKLTSATTGGDAVDMVFEAASA